MSIKQYLIRRLYKDFGLIVNHDDLVSFRRNPRCGDITSWSTIKRWPCIESKLTMSQAIKAPKLKIVEEDTHTLRIDLDLG